MTTGIALVASVSFLVGAVIVDPGNSLYALGLLALSVPAYAMFKSREHVLE